MTWARWVRRLALGAAGVMSVVATPSCVEKGSISQDTFQLRVALTLPDGSPLPDANNPLCLDLRGIGTGCPKNRELKLSVEAIGADGQRDVTFNRYVRVSVLPGTVVSVQSPSDGSGQGRSDGRNVLLSNGFASGQIVTLEGAFGPTRLIVEDLGYQPGDPTKPEKLPICADGVDNDGDGLTDFPADPGCAFSNDDTEDSGTFASGASPAINFALPTVAQAQGYSQGTPFSQEGIVLETQAPRAHLVVSRVSSGGFYVVDVDITKDGAGNEVATPKPYGSLFVFNFGLPEGVLVCDRVTYLSGTMDEFFGYTEMVFPSFEVEPFDTRPEARTTNRTCLVPEPLDVTPAVASDGALLEQHEAGLVRVRGARVAAHFGPQAPKVEQVGLNSSHPCNSAQPDPQNTKRYNFEPGASNCDFDRSGGLSFASGSEEALCSCFCFQDPDCSEWSSYVSRGNFRVVVGATKDETIQANTGAIPGFNPVAFSGRPLGSLTGVVSNFSGGNLNWTIEARCPEDLVACPAPADDSEQARQAADQACTENPPPGLPSSQACIGKRTAVDNDSASGN